MGGRSFIVVLHLMFIRDYFTCAGSIINMTLFICRLQQFSDLTGILVPFPRNSFQILSNTSAVAPALETSM